MKKPRISMFGFAALVGVLAVLPTACGNRAAESANAAAPSTTVGNDIDDAVVSTRVRSALMANPKINSYDFKVDTRKGEVMLSGFVDDQSQLELATATTRAVEGVKTVQNNVTLKGAAATVGNKVDDGITTTRVKSALLADPGIKSLEIGVVTRIDEVQLSGYVDNQQQMNRAVEIASGVPGVRTVTNEMQIKR
jgi:hyperosmotically inducible protein